MKKIISVLLVMLLCLSVSAGAFAEEVLVLNWEDIQPVVTVAGREGRFVSLEGVGWKLWIPSGMHAAQLSETDIEDGTVAYFMTEDAALDITRYELAISFDEVFAAMEGTEGISDLAVVMVNGAKFINYTYVPEKGISANVMTLVIDADYALEFTFTAADENAMLAFAVIAASIQPDV